MGISVLSLRNVEKRAFYDVTYEWEEDVAKFLGGSIKALSSVQYFICKAYCKINPKYKIHQTAKKEPVVYFVMFPKEMRAGGGIPINCVPVFIDIWQDADIDFILEKTKNLHLFYCTSMEVYYRIKERCPESLVKYMPLSVSDRYFSKDFSAYRSKDIDVIQLGRRNDVLHDFMMRYVKEHPQVEYVYTNGIMHDNVFEYESTKRGNIGTIRNREHFINTLASAKVSLVSTPAIDGSRKNANGIDLLTPRFYESAILGCAMLGRYGQNEETARLVGICPHIVDYEQFIVEMDRALTISPKLLYSRYERFIYDNLTVRRAEQIKEDWYAIVHNRIENTAEW